ncbi:MAG: YheV family putative zinc ribbon protein [Pseudomonadota bacterium]
MNPPRRRFIAGAVCPRCGEMDKITINLETDRRECVACDFSESRPEPGPVSELHTRVNRASARMVETKAEVVKLLDPARSKDSTGSNDSDS